MTDEEQLEEIKARLDAHARNSATNIQYLSGVLAGSELVLGDGKAAECLGEVDGRAAIPVVREEKVRLYTQAQLDSMGATLATVADAVRAEQEAALGPPAPLSAVGGGHVVIGDIRGSDEEEAERMRLWDAENPVVVEAATEVKADESP